MQRDTEARVGWVVDVQRDFMEPDGRLYVRDLGNDADPGAVQIVPALERALAWMYANTDLVVFTGDWHALDDPEIDPVAPDPARGTYPPHCMGRSPDPAERSGADLIPSLRPTDPIVLEVDAGAPEAVLAARAAMTTGRSLFIRKTRFDVFEGNRATEPFLVALAAAWERPLHMVVAGVARDVCVTGAVDGLQDRGHRVTAITDAMWGLGLESEAETLARWRSRGATLVTVDGLDASTHSHGAG